MNSVERPDLLLDETVNEITGVFEVEHVFPEVFKEEERNERVGLWDRIKSFFGFRRHPAEKVRRQQRASFRSGEEPGPGEGTVPGGSAAAAKLPSV